MSTRSFRGVRVVRFDDFELDIRAGELRRGGAKVRLQDQPYRILVMLLEHPGEVVLREEICRRLWPNGTVVEVSHGINAAVLRLRDALGDSAENPRFVETLARRGYRFLAKVEVECRRESAEALRPAPVRGPREGVCNTEALAGQTVSHFRVEEKLGRGGMGVVYRAEDLNLGRSVALKFLTAEMAGDAVAVGRFQREARTASALNHPNICTVYAVEECAGQPVIVMELLEGRTLEAILDEGPMSLDRALPLSIQMAAALDAAHRKAIVHRDLKPGNVVVTQSCLKVLDFGLAKQSVSGAAGAPTDVTQTGSILGTPNYMAPEQFHGRDADTRSDIYAFGLVLYEMLTGRRAVEDTQLKLPDSAAQVEPILFRAIEKDPENRWQTARDLKAALELVRPVPQAASATSAVRGPVLIPRPFRKRALAANRRRILALSGIAALAFFLITGAVYWKGLSFSPAAKSFVLTELGMSSPGHMNLSPDGKRLAFVAGNRLFVRTLDGMDTRLVATNEGKGVIGTPFWSPDGRKLAFTRSGKLSTVSAEGGPVFAICDSDTNLEGAWGPDGTILIGQVGDGLIAVPSDGGTPRKLTSPDSVREETRHMLPQFLPGGRRFLYTAGANRPAMGTLYIGSLDSPEKTPIMKIQSGARFVPWRHGSHDGYLVFEKDGYLVGRPFDTQMIQKQADTFSIAGPVTLSSSLAASATSVAAFSATESTLAYLSTGGSPLQLAAIDLPVRAPGVTAPAAKGGLVVLQNWVSALPR